MCVLGENSPIFKLFSLCVLLLPSKFHFALLPQMLHGVNQSGDADMGVEDSGEGRVCAAETPDGVGHGERSL